jgi:WD40 repeat protein
VLESNEKGRFDVTRVRSTLPAFLIVALACPLFAREWTDSTGQFRIEAELVSVKNEKVYLERSDGQVVAVPLERLSKEDLRYLASLPEYRSYFEAHAIDGQEPAATGGAEKTAPAAAKPAPPVAVDPQAGEVCRFGDLGWGVTSLAFSPDGRFLAAGKMDRAVMVFDVEKERRVAFIEDLNGLGQVTAARFSPDGRFLLTGGYSGRIQLWEVSAEGGLTEAHRFVGHSDAIQTITVSKDGSRVLSGGDEKKVRCWTLADGKEQFAIDGFSRSVKATFITRGGKQGLASDGEEIVLIDMGEGQAIQKMKLGNRSTQAVAIAPDGSIVVAQDSKGLAAWKIQSGDGCPLLEERDMQWSAEFLPNSKYLLSGGRGKVNLWEVDAHRKMYEFDVGGILYVKTIAVAPDNRLFAAIPSAAGQQIHVFRLPAETAAK